MLLLHRRKKRLFAIAIVALSLLLFLSFEYSGYYYYHHLVSAQELTSDQFTVQQVSSGLEFPTGMAFLGHDDILVIEKNKGTVQRIVNGEMLEEPLLDVNVVNDVERGLLGIAVLKNKLSDVTYVFLYYTEEAEDGDDGEGGDEDRGGEEEGDRGRDGEGGNGEPIGNRLYRYELSEGGTKLVNPKLLLDLPYEPGPAHNGGVIAIGSSSEYNNSNGNNSNNNVCVVIGNLYVPALNKGIETNLAVNVQDGEEPDGRAGIICVTEDGQKLNYDSEEGETAGGGGILGDEHPIDMYYAYGIRNSFGLAFDPITGNLWDTENGGFDEINLVEPGFNSGWNKISGSTEREENQKRFDHEDNLVDFGGRGKYSDPELDMGQHIAPTAILFFHSDMLGKEYENDMFVATAKGQIFHFDLKGDGRTELDLDDKLADKIADSQEELQDVIFADKLGSTITDLEVGFEDGYLYATIYEEDGKIIRILPSISSKTQQ